jgi:lysophospholipase L1-like esterase
MRVSGLLCVFGTADGITVSFVGDSITAGVCAGEGGAYPAMLKTLLPATFTVKAFGVSGMTMLKNGLQNGKPGGSYWNTTAYQDALTSEPGESVSSLTPSHHTLTAGPRCQQDVVTIMLGTNDAKVENWAGVQSQGDSFEADFHDMISIFKALPSKPKVYVAVPPPLFAPFPYNMNSTVINSVLPTLLRKIAKETDAEDEVIDVYSKIGFGQPCISCDGCHPNGDRKSSSPAARCVPRDRIAS